MAFTRVCGVGDVAPGEAQVFEGAAEPIAIFNLGGEFYAIGDTCTHGEWSLAEGYIDGDEVECSLHQGTFCIKTGEAKQYPASEPVRVYPVRVEDGFVAVDPDGGYFTSE